MAHVKSSQMSCYVPCSFLVCGTACCDQWRALLPSAALSTGGREAHTMAECAGTSCRRLSYGRQHRQTWLSVLNRNRGVATCHKLTPAHLLVLLETSRASNRTFVRCALVVLEVLLPCAPEPFAAPCCCCGGPPLAAEPRMGALGPLPPLLPCCWLIASSCGGSATSGAAADAQTVRRPRLRTWGVRDVG